MVEWQTRTLEGRMGDREGSSPSDRTTYDFTIVVVKSTKKQSNRAVFCILGGL